MVIYVIRCQELIGNNFRKHLPHFSPSHQPAVPPLPPTTVTFISLGYLYRAMKHLPLNCNRIGMCSHLLPNLGGSIWTGPSTKDCPKRFVVVFSTRLPLVLASHCAQSRCSAIDTRLLHSASLQPVSIQLWLKRSFMTNLTSSKPLSACIGICRINIDQGTPISAAKAVNGFEQPWLLV